MFRVQPEPQRGLLAAQALRRRRARPAAGGAPGAGRSPRRSGPGARATPTRARRRPRGPPGRPRPARGPPDGPSRPGPGGRSGWRPRAARAPTSSRSRIEPALRTRTRNVAWKASSTSWGSASIRRQTPRTIGPSRPTSASKAASSRRSANRPSELAVAQAGDRVALEDPDQVPADRVGSPARPAHDRSLPGVRPPSITARRGPATRRFSGIVRKRRITRRPACPEDAGEKPPESDRLKARPSRWAEGTRKGTNGLGGLIRA